MTHLKTRATVQWQRHAPASGLLLGLLQRFTKRVHTRMASKAKTKPKKNSEAEAVLGGFVWLLCFFRSPSPPERASIIQEFMIASSTYPTSQLE